MSEDKTPYIPAEPENDADDWDLEVKDGIVTLLVSGPTYHGRIELGPTDAVFTRLADKMASEDFGER